MNDAFLISTLRGARPNEDTKNFNAFDFIHAFGSGHDALLYAKLFWPDFVEFKGMVFLSQTVEYEDDRKRIEEALKRYCDDLTKTEESFNVIEVSQLFGRRIGETDEEEDRFLCEILAEVWSGRLETLFPNYTFIVKVVECENAGEETAIIFHRDRNQAEA